MKKVLDVQQRKEYWGRAVFYSPRKVAEAQWCERIKARDKKGKQLRNRLQWSSVSQIGFLI
jgi:hypothetical protein